MDYSLHNKLAPLYKIYTETLKPLIAEIEIQYEKHPVQLYNEIRAFNDHVARYYRDGITEQEVDKQVAKAMGHWERLTLDCYKFLNIHCHDKTVKNFEKWIKRVDLTIINNGEFYLKYKELHKNAILNLKKAKQMESIDKDGSIDLYQQAHNHYANLETLFDDNHVSLCWAKAKFSVSKATKILLWFLATIISGITSSIFIPWSKLWELFTDFFR
jgi:hypothetical protein